MFFATKESIPEGMGFSTFGATHLIWLAVLTLVGFALLYFYKKADGKARKIMRTTLGVMILLNEITKNTVAVITNTFDIGLLPFHLCGINILLITFDIFKPTKVVRNFLYYFCIPGAMLALLFPNWTVLPCMNFYHIHSFTIHALLVYYPLMLIIDGEIKPKFKNMLGCILLLLGMAVPIYFINLLCDTNFMFLMDPETGNPLGLFEKYFGSHLWGFPVLLPIVMFIMYMPLKIFSKAEKSEKVIIETEKESVAK